MTVAPSTRKKLSIIMKRRWLSEEKDKMKGFLQENAKKRIGQPNVGRGAATEDNWASLYWKIENKAIGVILEGNNLNDLVRQNSNLFLPEDVIWRGSKCRASKGLRSLFETTQKKGRYTPKFWKGWSALDKSEITL